MGNYLPKAKQSLATLSLILIISLFLLQFGLYTSPKNFFWDFLANLQMRLVHLSPEKNPVVIVSIDEESMIKLQIQWPWNREVVAELLEKIAEHEPRVVGIDLFFAGQSGVQKHDERLKTAIKNIGRCVLASFINTEGFEEKPYQSIMEASNEMGFINLPIADGKVIRAIVPAAINADGEVIRPSFATAVAMNYEGIKQDLVMKKKGRFFVLSLKETPDSGRPQIFFRASTPYLQSGTKYFFDPDEIPRIPAWKFFQDDTGLDMLKDKIVLLGIESPLVKDDFLTPVGRHSGVSIHALHTLAMLKKESVLLMRPAQSMLLFLFTVPMLALFMTFKQRWISILAAVLLIISVLGLSIIFYLFLDRFIDPSPAVTGLLMLLIFSFVYEDASSLVQIIRLNNQLGTDSLTKVHNFDYFKLSAGRILKEMKTEEMVTLVIFDIDHFKEINDTNGHDRGNDALTSFAWCLKKAKRARDIVARFGGDEFCVLLDGGSREGLDLYISRVQQLIDHAFEEDTSPRFTFSAGACIAGYGKISSFKDLFDAADKVLYESKRAGRNQINSKTL